MVLAAVMLLLLSPTVCTAENKMNVQTHTVQQIRNRIATCGASLDDPVTYKEKPVLTAPYNPGVLSNETQKSALTILNNIRYIAGLDADVELKNDYVSKAQAGMLLNQVNNEINHNPSKPKDMDDSLYNLGYSGTSSSNIGWGYGTLGDAIMFGWMNDGDSDNIDRVGHRRWVLNPGMKYTGFGYVGTHSAMYSFDGAWYDGPYKNVTWPAQNMPTDYFTADYPWSLSTGNYEDISAVKVTLIRKKDGKKWVFSENSSNGAFYLNNDNYGQTGCIIFRPNQINEYGDGDVFSVKIEGLKDGTLEYEVHFFDLAIRVTSVTISGNTHDVLEGNSIQLTAKVAPDNAENKTVTWSSSNTDIATVSQSGLVKVKAGSAGKSVTIKATANDKSKKSGSWKITSKPVKVSSVKITGSTHAVPEGKTLQLKATVVPGNATNKKVKWSSSNTNVATVNQSGLVTVKSGTHGKNVTIKATAQDGSGKSASWNITSKFYVKVGSIHTISGNRYKVTSKSTVCYKEPVSKKITSIRIPKSVEINGKKYKVTAIAGKAFFNCRKLKKVIIKSPIKKIGKYAFYKCKKLKTIRIYSRKLTKSNVLKGAFKGISKKATFYVPSGKKASYRKILLKRGAKKTMKFKTN